MAIVVGGPDADSLPGGAGRDVILGLAGRDTLTGGAGADTILGGAENDVIAGENAAGSPPARPPSGNIVFGGAGNDLVRAGLGADSVWGGDGGDDLRGGLEPSDAVFVGGDAGASLAFDGCDLLRGDRGDDRLDGAAGADTLVGGDGDDRLLGGPGVDLLVGGPGEDEFAFGFFLFLDPDTGVGEGARDVVADFDPGSDRVDLSLYREPLPFRPSDEPPVVFLGTGPSVDSGALQLRYVLEGGRTILQFFSPYAVPDGLPRPPVPTAPTGEIEFAGLRGLAAGDFAGEVEDRSGPPGDGWAGADGYAPAAAGPWLL